MTGDEYLIPAVTVLVLAVVFAAGVSLIRSQPNSGWGRGVRPTWNRRTPHLERHLLDLGLRPVDLTWGDPVGLLGASRPTLPVDAFGGYSPGTEIDRAFEGEIHGRRVQLVEVRGRQQAPSWLSVLISLISAVVVRPEPEDRWLASVRLPASLDELHILPLQVPVPADGAGTELERFNRLFQVEPSEGRFSRMVLDARLMAWLLDRPRDGVRFAVKGGSATAISAAVPRTRAEFQRFLDTALSFADHIPRVALDAYRIGADSNDVSRPS